MPEEQEDKGKTADTDGSQGVTVDQAEFEQFKAAKKFQDEMFDRAKDMGMEDPTEYVDTLESLANSKVTEQLDKPKDKSKEEPKEEKHAGLSESDRITLQQTAMQSAQAKLASDWAEFRIDQSESEEKTPYKRDELFKVIKDQVDLVAKVAAKMNGNLYTAANHILSVTDPEAKAKAVKAAEAAKAAKANAAKSADITSGGRTADAHETSTQDKLKVEHKKMQDSIMRDDAPVV